MGGDARRARGPAPAPRPSALGYLGQSHASGFVLPLRAIDIVRMARFPNRGLFGRMTRRTTTWCAGRCGRWGWRVLRDGSRSASLSGGQQQRVYLAQVLARRADLIVLDEPTAGLDAGGRELYLAAFAARAGQRAPRS